MRSTAVFVAAARHFSRSSATSRASPRGSICCLTLVWLRPGTWAAITQAVRATSTAMTRAEFRLEESAGAVIIGTVLQLGASGEGSPIGFNPHRIYVHLTALTERAQVR